MRLRSFLQAQAAWAVARIVNRSLFSISLIFKRLLYRQHTVRNSVELQGRYGVTPCLFVYFLGSTPKSVLAKKEKNILAYGVEGGNSSRARGKRPPVTEYAVKYVFWQRAFFCNYYFHNQTLFKYVTFEFCRKLSIHIILLTL